jgi:exodeoxyribonuclease V beta subunit
VLCHDPDDDDQAVVDLGSDQLEKWRPQACREEMAENLRLLYVALTRAKSRCYLIWGKINELGSRVANRPRLLGGASTWCH